MPGRTFALDEVVKIMSTYDTVRRAAGAGAAAKAEAAAEAAAAAAGLDLPAFTALVRDVIAFEEAKKAEALATPAKINAAFDRVDKDKSGTIDARELAAALGAMGVPGDAGHVRAAIRRYGGARAQTLDRAEFARLTRELLAHQQTEAARQDTNGSVQAGLRPLRHRQVRDDRGGRARPRPRRADAGAAQRRARDGKDPRKVPAAR